MRPDQPGWLGIRLAAGTLLAASLILLYFAFQIRQGAGYSVVGTLFFPLIVVLGLIGFSILLLLRTTVWPDHDLAEHATAEEAATHWGTTGLTGLALVLYAFALGPLGYVAATSLFFPAVARVLGSKQPLRDIIIAVLLSLVVYIGFTRFLGVRLPAGILAGIF